jgi:transposase
MPGLSAPLLHHASAQLSSPTPSILTNQCLTPLSRPASAPLPDMAIRSSFLDDASVHSERVANAKPANGHTHSVPLHTSTASDATIQSPAVQEPLPLPIPIPDLNQISHLLSQAKYHKKRRLQTQRLFHRLQTAASRTQRLAVASRHVRRTLADCLRFEDKHSFAHLFNTFHLACDQSSSLPPAGAQDLEPSESLPGDFLDDISSSSRETTIQLLTRLRYDKKFVADRIALLSQRELTALLSDGTSARRAESVLGGSQRTSTRSAKPLGFVVDRVVDDISGGGFRSSLETLVHLNSSASPGRSDCARSKELWAHVAARVISDRKSGGDRLTSALLDIWSHQSDWPGKNRLRTWMLHTLQRGQFLLDQPSRQSFRMRVHGQVDLPADETVRTEAFYKDSVDQLLELLGDPHGPSVIPDAAVDLTMAIHASLGARPDHQKDLSSFVTTRWLFGSFLMDLIILPESHGLLNGHYISEPARLKILKEVAARCQKVVYDVVYAW